MERIVSAASEVVAREDSPEKSGDEIRELVQSLEKPELSSEAEACMRALVEKVKEELGSGDYADGDIEAAIRAVLSAAHSN